MQSSSCPTLNAPNLNHHGKQRGRTRSPGEFSPMDCHAACPGDRGVAQQGSPSVARVLSCFLCLIRSSGEALLSTRENMRCIECLVGARHISRLKTGHAYPKETLSSSASEIAAAVRVRQALGTKWSQKRQGWQLWLEGHGPLTLL